MNFFENPNFDRHKWLFLTGGVVCLFLAFSLTALFGGKFAPANVPKDDPTEFVTQETGQAQAGNSNADRWMVYVTGAVMHPGVYEVPVGARVNDALQKAGGFSIHADPEATNLAAKIEDGAHIRIPEKGEAKQEEPSAPVMQTGQLPLFRNAASSAKEQAATGRIDINRASAVELQNLPGIGPKLSQAIVDYREANGSFKSAEDLKNVRGIGEKRFEAVRDLVTISQ